ncbi:MAG: ribonuclease J, partial [Deltaproteobacteria bacterium]
MTILDTSAGLKVIPLGGMGEIGMNCLVLEQRVSGEPDRLLIDCGVSFPFGDYGVDTYGPRLDYLLDQPAALQGVVLTHAHEDHAGALVRLLLALEDELRSEQRRLPVWAPAYAIELVRLRLEETPRASQLVALRPTGPGQRFGAGSFTVEPIRVTHSMVDSTALAIDTVVGKVLHTGDFKLDSGPADGELTDVARLGRLGDGGVRLLLSDSTNVLEPGASGSEADAAEALYAVIGSANRRAVVGLFASNLHRLHAVGEAARRHGRKLCLLGRSLHVHSTIGLRLGRLDWPSDLLISAELASRLPANQVVYAVTGTQGEPRAALRRLASDRHGDLRLEPGDTVVLSSRVIPGNERAVQCLVGDLLGLGVQLRSRTTDPRLHVSGHGHREELRKMLSLVRPEAFIPLHGTPLHLQHHAALARQVGVGQVLVLRDGEVAHLTVEGIGMATPVPVGKVAMAAGIELDDGVLQQRRILGRCGVVFVVVATGSGHGGVSVAVKVKGLPLADEIVSETTRAARLAVTGK